MVNATGADAAVEVACRISQGYVIYAGCFPINVIPPPLSLFFDIGLSQAGSRVPLIGSLTDPQSGILGRGPGGRGLTGRNKNPFTKKFAPTKFNTATAWTMGDGIGAPFAVGQAASDWFSAANQLGQARTRLEQLTHSLTPDQWSGKDREAFNAELTQLAQQIGDAEFFAQAVGFSLSGATFPLGAWPIGCSIVGVIQATNATLYYGALAGIFTSVAAPAIYASGLATSITCNRSLSMGRLALSTILNVAGASVVGFALKNAFDQTSHGDEDAKADLVRATVEMTVEQAVNALITSGVDALTPGRVDLLDDLLHPGKNNDGTTQLTERLIDELPFDPREEAGNRVGDLVHDDETDRGPFSGS